MIIPAILILLFLFLWFWFSYGDWKNKTIANRELLLSALPALFLSLAVLPGAFRLEPFIGLSASLIWAVGLWYARIWPAGDAKLFILLSLFLPYGKDLSPLWLLFDQAVNIFVLAACWFLLEGIFIGFKNKTLGSRALSVYRSRGSLALGRTWPGLLLMYGAAVLVTRLLISFFHFTQIASVVISFWVAGQLLTVSSKMKRSSVLAWSCLCFAALYEISPGGLRSFIVMVSIILIEGMSVRFGLWALDSFMRQGETIVIFTQDIRPRQVLADSFLKRLNNESPETLKNLGPLYPDGLLASQVAMIRSWAETRNVETLEIHAVHAFTFWIFLGTAATWLLRQDVIGFLWRRVAALG